MKHIYDDLKDNENVVHYFCEQNKSNQIWASDRIKSLANETGVEVHKYLKAKYYTNQWMQSLIIKRIKNKLKFN